MQILLVSHRAYFPVTCFFSYLAVMCHWILRVCFTNLLSGHAVPLTCRISLQMAASERLGSLISDRGLMLLNGLLLIWSYGYLHSYVDLYPGIDPRNLQGTAVKDGSPSPLFLPPFTKTVLFWAFSHYSLIYEICDSAISASQWPILSWSNVQNYVFACV